MKHLKYHNMFAEHKALPIAVLVLLMIVNGSFCQKLSDQNRLTALCVILLAIIFPIAFCLWLLFLCNAPSDAEREKIAEAKPIRWTALNSGQRAALANETSVLPIWWIFLFVAETIILFILTLKLRNLTGTLIVAFLMYVPTLLGLLHERRKACFWSEIDSTAEAASLDIAYIFSRRSYGGKGYRKRLHYYCVCYLPDGKYIFNADMTGNNSKEVVIVRFRGKYIYYVR